MAFNYERDVVLKDLQENVVEVRFNKVDGTLRRMRCTLMPNLLPPNVDFNYLKEQHNKEENKNVVACWDVENNGWRSFRMDSIVYLQAIDAY